MHMHHAEEYPYTIKINNNNKHGFGHLAGPHPHRKSHWPSCPGKPAQSVFLPRLTHIRADTRYGLWSYRAYLHRCTPLHYFVCVNANSKSGDQLMVIGSFIRSVHIVPPQTSMTDRSVGATPKGPSCSGWSERRADGARPPLLT
jgi:hypothetical protein